MHYHPFKTEYLNPPYDSIVIGSGIGGLACAALLSKLGKKVLVLERHYVAGGFTHTFYRKGYEWDVGVHYIGEVQRKDSMLRKVFDCITNEKLKWAEMPSVYDRIVFPDAEYEFVAGTRNFRDKLCSYFPEEHKAIDQYLELVYSLASSAKGYFGAKALPPFVSKIASPFLSSKFLKLAQKTTLEVVSSLTQNKKLIGVLTAQYGDYGLPPAQSSFAIHAMVVKHYLGGAAYPIGGSGKIAEDILPIIQSKGGDVLVRAEVKEILVKGNKTYGVKMANGEEIEAKQVISDAGFLNTVTKIIPKENIEKTGYYNHLKKVKASTAHLCIYIGIKESGATLNLPKNNYWIYPGYDHDENLRAYFANPEKAPPAVTYISFPSSKDPDWEKRFPGKSTIEIIGVAPYEWFSKWKDTPWNKRGEDYIAFKNKLAEPLFENLYKYLPQVKGKIEHFEISSPLSTQHFCNYDQGEIYGLDHTPERFNATWLRPHTPLQNFFLTGQDIVSDGIGGALMAGVLTASAITKKNLMKDILTSNFK